MGPALREFRFDLPLRRRTRDSSDLLQRVARRFKGDVVSESGHAPHALIRIQGHQYRVCFCKGKFENSRDFVSVTTLWPSKSIRNTDSDEPATAGVKAVPNFRMSITPTRTWEGLTGIQDIEIGNLFFDTRFVIQTNDEEILVDTLTKQCQILINTIYSQYYEKQFELRVVGNELHLDSHFQVSRPGKTFLILRTFAELHRELLSANEVAYSVDVDVIDWSGSTTCLICGEKVVEKPVKCRSCMTEYHLDCWQYVGRCGRYACGEQGFLRFEGGQGSETFRID